MSEQKDVAREMVEEFRKLSTCNISDALDKLKLAGVVPGILPVWSGCPAIAGPAVTVKLSKAGTVAIHLGLLQAIEIARPGDVIVIDNRGDALMNSWGGLVANIAKDRKVAGTVIDGATRDVDTLKELGYPVFARGIVPMTARGRVALEAINVPIQCGTARVEPRDIVVADGNGVAVVAGERAQEVLRTAKIFEQIENNILEAVKKGMSPLEAHERYRYEKMVSE